MSHFRRQNPHFHAHENPLEPCMHCRHCALVSFASCAEDPSRERSTGTSTMSHLPQPPTCNVVNQRRWRQHAGEYRYPKLKSERRTNPQAEELFPSLRAPKPPQHRKAAAAGVDTTGWKTHAQHHHRSHQIPEQRARVIRRASLLCARRPWAWQCTVGQWPLGRQPRMTSAHDELTNRALEPGETSSGSC